MQAILAFLSALGWDKLIELGVYLVGAGRDMANSEGIDPTVVDARVAAAEKGRADSAAAMTAKWGALLK